MMYRYTKQITLYSPFNTFTTWTVKLRVVKFILENKDELNFIDELESYSVVPQLVFKKQIEVMAVLKPHLTNFQSRYAICLATQEGHIEFLKLLKDEFHNDLIARYPGGATLLHEAAKRGHAEVVEFLLTQTKMLPTDEDDSGITPLDIAVRYGRAAIVKTFAKHLDEQNFTKIAEKQYTSWIIDHGSNRSTFCFDREGSNLFQIAAEQGDYKVLKELCKKVPNPNIPNNKGNTATHRAAGNGHFEIVKLLTSYTSKANVANDLGVTPSALARSKGYHEIANYLERMARKRKFDELN